MAVNNISVANTNYNGEVLGTILTQAFLGNEIAEKGVLHVEAGIEKKFSIPRMRIGKLLQKRVEMPDATNEKGDLTYDEKELNPEDMMVYTTFNPKSFESVWRPFQPTGNMVFYQLPGDVQSKILNLILMETATEVGDHYINGLKGSGEEQFFNGIVSRILSDNEVVYAKAGETTWVKKLQALKDAVPVEIVDNPRLAIIMNTRDYGKYDAELKSQQYKNADPTQKREQAFDGTPIIRLAKWPEGLVVATLVGSGEESNLWAGVNLNNDGETLFVDKVSNAGEKYFVKILLKADTNIAWGGYIAVLDERAGAASGYIVDYSGTATTLATSGVQLGATYRYTNSGTSKVTIASGLAEGVNGDVEGKATRVFHFNGNAWF